MPRVHCPLSSDEHHLHVILNRPVASARPSSRVGYRPIVSTSSWHSLINACVRAKGLACVGYELHLPKNGCIARMYARHSRPSVPRLRVWKLRESEQLSHGHPASRSQFCDPSHCLTLERRSIASLHHTRPPSRHFENQCRFGVSPRMAKAVAFCKN